VRALVEAFWPGPLTLVIEHAPSLAWDLGDDRGAVSIRMPMHPVALELLARTGRWRCPARTGPAPGCRCRPKDAQEQLGYAVAVYLDGGPCIDPSPSTIVDVTGPTPVLLRRGQGVAAPAAGGRAGAGGGRPTPAGHVISDVT
jgi:tRNA threonylcarbamoyl adenosine modification protein (Sua5/YciO/YrdC/YwlC family)